MTEAKLSDAEVIAQRSADIAGDEAVDSEHVKVFVLPPGPKPTESNGFDHDANKVATRQYAISQGLRPTGDVRHVSTKGFGPGGLSWALTYAVPVVPADRFDYTPETAPEVITEAETDDDGKVHTNTEGNGNTPSSTPDAEGDEPSQAAASDASSLPADATPADGSTGDEFGKPSDAPADKPTA